MNKVKEMHQAIWRTALRKGSLELAFKSKSEASRIRFALYNAVKEFKGEARAEADKELLDAIDTMSIRIKRDNPCVLQMVPKLQADVPEVMLALLQENPSAMKDETQMRLESMQEKALQKAQQEPNIRATMVGTGIYQGVRVVPD